MTIKRSYGCRTCADSSTFEGSVPFAMFPIELAWPPNPTRSSRNFATEALNVDGLPATTGNTASKAMKNRMTTKSIVLDCLLL